jgi:hypothetical protein
MFHDTLGATEIRAFQPIESFPEVKQAALGREVEDAQRSGHCHCEPFAPRRDYALTIIHQQRELGGPA